MQVLLYALKFWLSFQLLPPRQVWTTNIPPKCLPIWHCVSVDPGGGQRLEACHHHQTGLNTSFSTASLLYLYQQWRWLFFFSCELVHHSVICSYGLIMTSNCTVQSLNTFLYCVNPGVLTAVNARWSLFNPIDYHAYPLTPPGTAASRSVLHTSSYPTGNVLRMSELSWMAMNSSAGRIAAMSGGI